MKENRNVPKDPFMTGNALHVPMPVPADTARTRLVHPDDVVRLNQMQTAGQYHPYTCANRGDGEHRVFNGDLGALVATVNGWICPFCDYTQDWAHPLPPA